MNSEPPVNDDQREEADQQLLETLLSRALRDDSKGDQQRIERLLQAIEAEAAERNVERPSHQSPSRLMRWGIFALAASLLIGVALWWQAFNPTRQAYAAVQRSLQLAEASGIRYYQLRTIVRRWGVGEREILSDLYVDGADRFVLRQPGPLGLADYWIGSDAKESWVAPPRGPVFIGKPEIAQQWLRRQEDVDMPYLHITSILRRLSDGYDLTKLPDEEIADPDQPQTLYRCRHIRGVLRPTKARIDPEIVDLWTDIETGVARQIKLDWQRTPRQFGIMTMQIDLLPQPNLPADWFTPAAHHQGRPALGFPTQD